MTVHEMLLPPAFTERQLKVAADYVPAGKRDSQYAPVKKIPWIQLKGLWLQQAGFEVNDIIRVRIIKGCLVITTANKNPAEAGDFDDAPALLEPPYLGTKPSGQLIKLPGSLR
jgi:toxic protein SymE